MSYFLNKPIKPSNISIVPKGELTSDSVLDALYELDSDLQNTNKKVNEKFIVGNTAPTSGDSLWIDLNEN